MAVPGTQPGMMSLATTQEHRHGFSSKPCPREAPLKRPDQSCNVDQGIFGHLALRNLAVLAEERGDRVETRRLWRMVLDACPGDAQAMVRGEAER